jgi:thioredoxin-like negative regulator of GroEL
LAIAVITLAVASALVRLARDPAPAAARARAEVPRPTTVRIADPAAFAAQVAAATVPVLVDFNSRACAPCALLSPVLDGFARSHPDQALVLSVDVLQVPELAARFQAEDLPLVVRLDHGVETARFTGVKDAAQLAAWMAAQHP